MTEDEPRRPGAHRPGRTRTLAAGVVAVGLAAVAAGAAVSASRRGEGPPPDRPGEGTTAAPASPDRSGLSRRVTHEFPDGYVGPVWLTLTVDDGAPHEVELTWGPWRRWFRQQDRGPVTYWFEKKDAVSEPLSAKVPDGVTASFGQGERPADAVDARPGWSNRPGAPVPVPTGSR